MEQHGLPLSDEAELRSQAWWVGYGHPFQTLEELNERVGKILAKVGAFNEHTIFWTLSPLREAAHLFYSKTLETFVSTWLQYGERYPNGIDNALLSVERLFVSGTTSTRRLIHDQVRSSPFYSSLQDPRIATVLKAPEIRTGFSVAGDRARSREYGTRQRVALVVPNFLSGKSFRQPPLDLLLAATVLREHGLDCELFDERVSNRHPEELAAECQGFDYIVITTTPYDQVQTYYVDFRLVNSLRTARLLKERCANASVVLCGSHASVRPDLAFAETNVDFIIRGEVEEAIADLIVHLRDRATLVNPNVLSPSSSVQPANEGVFESFGRAINLDRLPAYDLVNFGNYYGDGYRDGMPFHKRRAGAVLATRGCPFSCDFCFNYWGRRVHKRSVESVVEELELLEKTYSVSTVFFVDFTFTVDRKWVADFCATYRARRLRISWSCETRPDLIDLEIAREMAASGCTEVWLGAESFSQDVIGVSGKGFSVAATLEAIHCLRAAGLAAHTFIMIGLPGETVATLNSTIRQLHAVKTPYTQSVIVATPRFGTKYFEMAKAQYPHLNLDQSFYGVGAVKGLVANSLTPALIQDAVSLLARRTDVFDSAAPPTLTH